jgi:hypothetical protein
MSSATRTTFASVIALVALSWTPSVIAGESSISLAIPDDVATPSVISSIYALGPASLSIAVDVRRSPFGSKPISSAALAARRGGDRTSNENQLRGVVADNHASNLTTGSNVISEGAFSGSVGLPMVIQNSGNNVLIQNATIVNVQLK